MHPNAQSFWLKYCTHFSFLLPKYVPMSPCNTPWGQRGRRSIALLILKLGAICSDQLIPRPGHFDPRNKPTLYRILSGPQDQSGRTWGREKSLAPGRFPTPDLPRLSESVYQLRQPGRHIPSCGHHHIWLRVKSMELLTAQFTTPSTLKFHVTLGPK